MDHSKTRHFFVIALLLIMSFTLSSCDKFGIKIGGEKNGLEVPTMVPEANAVQLQRDEKGLTEVDRQYLAYAKEKWKFLQEDFLAFGAAIDDYIDDVKNGKIMYVVDSKDYTNSRDALLKAVQRIEAVDPTQVPEAMKTLFEKQSIVANRARHLIFQVEQVNATNLPQEYDSIKAEILPFKEDVENFFDMVDSEGLEAAAAAIPATDWAAEANRPLNLRNTMNVADYGLKWGSSRWDVMGVEGMQESGLLQDVISYDTIIYQYSAVRHYHFNEYGQLDMYTYDIDPDSFNRGIYSDDPLYDDIKEIGSVMMFFFVTDSPALPQDPLVDAAGNLTITMDVPSEVAILSGNPLDGSITLTVTGKTVD